jgi:multidrug efflux pump subunit AcrA (membrane-fusion protein)
VQVEPIGEAVFSPAIEMVSQLSTTTDVALRPQVEGRVVQILGQQGQQVEAGQPILVLDTRSSGLPSMRPAPRRAGTR